MRFLFLLCALLLSCGARDTALTAPASVGSEWQLAGQEAVPADRAAPGAKELGLKQLGMARYAGPGNPEAALHQMTSDSGAFEMAQKWRPQPGSLAAHKGSIFVVVRSGEMDARELNRFVSLFEAALR